MIYIPVWLDQKCLNNSNSSCIDDNLHSSMVRLEIEEYRAAEDRKNKFTFQYGQIRNHYHI